MAKIRKLRGKGKKHHIKKYKKCNKGKGRGKGKRLVNYLERKYDLGI